MQATKRQDLFNFLAHGDDEHRAWLKEAIDAFFDGKTKPPVRGKGSKEPIDADFEDV